MKAITKAAVNGAASNATPATGQPTTLRISPEQSGDLRDGHCRAHSQHR